MSNLISKVLRDKPVHEVASAVKTMLDAGFDKRLILKIIYFAGTANSVFMANFAYTMLASGIEMMPQLATWAHVICLRSKQFLPSTIDTVKIFIHALKACGCEREFNWSCLESAFSFLYIDHADLDNFTHHNALQLSPALYIANAWMIEDFKGASSIRAVTLNRAILSNLMKFNICPLQHLSHDWIVVLDRYLRLGKNVDLRALKTVILFVKNRGSAQSIKVGLRVDDHMSLPISIPFHLLQDLTLIMAVTRTIFKIKMDDRASRLAWYDAIRVLMEEASIGLPLKGT